ncbi:MAG: alpha/beta fold hydrolase, partial [Anaerolineales bacterium]|nr:alpha/beta fold hydrolase [Anaerolineales bacterium]
GYTGTRYNMLRYAPLFWPRGCDLLMYDARGHGASDGRYHTFGYYEKGDAEAAVDWLEAQTGLPQSHIGMLGISYGAGTALQTAPLLPDLAFIIADSPYADLETIMRYQAVQQYGQAVNMMIPGAWVAAEAMADFDVAAVSAVTAVAQAQMPIMLIHSQADEYTPPSNSEAIYANSDHGRTVLYLTDWGSSHGADITNNYAGFAQYVDEFLQTYAPDFGRH